MIMSLSSSTTEKIRGSVIALIAPLWEKGAQIKTYFLEPNALKRKSSSTLSPQEEIQHLQLENYFINKELKYLSSLLEDKALIDASLSHNLDIPELENHYKKYISRLKTQVEYKINALPAKIIFRTLDTWNSSFWINVGESNNEEGKAKIVAKNSPVLVGNSVVGIIDYVGNKQSRVTLITDSRLTPSVRVSRGGDQQTLISEQIEFFLAALKRKKEQLLEDDEKQALVQLLKKMKGHLQPDKQSLYLAKGELQGIARPNGRTANKVLKGSGFNYDFTDEEGPSRDLRTGSTSHLSSNDSIPLLKVNDLLITTGMDGIFPPSLKVATISKVALLKEGDFFYELEAIPTAGNLNELSLVFVLPPVGYDKNEVKNEK